MFLSEQCPHTISCPLSSSRAQCFLAVLLSTSLDKREQISSGSAPTSFLWFTLHIQKCQAVNSSSRFFLPQCKNSPVTHSYPFSPLVKFPWPFCCQSKFHLHEAKKSSSASQNPKEHTAPPSFLWGPASEHPLSPAHGIYPQRHSSSSFIDKIEDPSLQLRSLHLPHLHSIQHNSSFFTLYQGKLLFITETNNCSYQTGVQFQCCACKAVLHPFPFLFTLLMVLLYKI